MAEIYLGKPGAIIEAWCKSKYPVESIFKFTTLNGDHIHEGTVSRIEGNGQTPVTIHCTLCNEDLKTENITSLSGNENSPLIYVTGCDYYGEEYVVGWKNLTTLDVKSLSTTGDYAFNYAPLTTINGTYFVSLGYKTFYGCNKFTYINLKNLATLPNDGMVFSGTNSALTVDMSENINFSESDRETIKNAFNLTEDQTQNLLLRS